MIDDSFRLSRRGALICLSGMIAAPFVIRRAGVLMPVRIARCSRIAGT